LQAVAQEAEIRVGDLKLKLSQNAAHLEKVRQDISSKEKELGSDAGSEAVKTLSVGILLW
jgi:hypothetical protein